MIPREWVSLKRGPNQKILSITLAPSTLYTRTDEVNYRILRVTGDMESSSPSVLCRYLMESFGTWAYSSAADPRNVCYFNGNRDISSKLKSLPKTLGLQVEPVDVTADGEVEDFARHALLASLVQHLLGPGGMERIQIEHESDLCFARARSEGSEFLDVVAIDNLIISDARDKAHLNVSAFVYRRQPWQEPTREEVRLPKPAGLEVTHSYSLAYLPSRPSHSHSPPHAITHPPSHPPPPLLPRSSARGNTSRELPSWLPRDSQAPSSSSATCTSPRAPETSSGPTSSPRPMWAAAPGASCSSCQIPCSALFTTGSSARACG